MYPWSSLRICYRCWQIPIAYLLSTTLEMGPRGVYAAVAIAESTLPVIALIVFRRGRWQQQRI